MRTNPAHIPRSRPTRKSVIHVVAPGLLGLLVVGATVAQTGSGQPSQGLMWARQAVPAPRTVAFQEPADNQSKYLGFMVRPASGSLDPAQSVQTMPDFSNDQDIQTKKTRFFDFLLPLVVQENGRIQAIRVRLSYIQDHVRWKKKVSPEDREWLESVVREFGLDEQDPTSTDFWVEALLRVDSIPEDLVLVQAANESAWGTSRFAQEGNNLFGQWCFDQGCGLVPAGRPDGATYEVAKFETVSESIGSYLHNLNTGRTYQLLREIRARMREEGMEPDPSELAAGLVDYSERGLEYVNELRAMLRQNAEIIEEVQD